MTEGGSREKEKDDPLTTGTRRSLKYSNTKEELLLITFI